MPEYTISQDETEELIEKDDSQGYRVRITGAPVKITRAGDRRYTGDGLTYPTGYVGPIHNDGDNRVWAKNVGNGPDANIEIDQNLSQPGAFDPEQSGTQTVSDDGNFTSDVSDRSGRNLGKTRLMDSGEALIDPVDVGDLQQVTDNTSTAGQYATIDLGTMRRNVDIAVQTNGAATLTVEVSTDPSGGWDPVDTVDYSSAQSSPIALEQYEFALRHVRAKVDQNLDAIVIVSRGA